jgi:hypothetical protein
MLSLKLDSDGWKNGVLNIDCFDERDRIEDNKNEQKLRIYVPQFLCQEEREV